jgi:4a-hydroxytetrahydrobiopterin dehydratase
MTPPLFDLMALARIECQPLGPAQPYPDAQVDAQRVALPGWTLHEQGLRKRFTFATWTQTIEFVNALARIAHVQDHHPDLEVSYGHCTVRWSTHTVGGLSLKDFICAARTESLNCIRDQASEQ